MNEVVNSILTSVVPAIATAIVGYLVARKKYNAEASGSELDNVEKALAIYRSMVQDLSAKKRELEEQVERLEKLIEEYKQKTRN
jgi:predicted RNase H-like nuclease (RuvC/YqgF family)